MEKNDAIEEDGATGKIFGKRSLVTSKYLYHTLKSNING